MVEEYTLRLSTRSDKRYMIINLQTRRTIHFGSQEHFNYTSYSPDIRDNRRLLYIKRHRINSKQLKPNSALFWSYYLLWNKPTLSASIKDTENKFNISIINRT